MENKLEFAKEILSKYEQEHIMQLINRFDGEKQERIVDSVLSIDFEELKSLYEKAKEPLYIDESNLEPVTSLIKDKLPKQVIDSYIEAGESVVKGCKYAVVTMAGGQGTRLRKY